MRLEHEHAPVLYSNANDASTLITAGGVDSIGLMQMTQQIAQATGVSEKMLEERMPAESVKNATVAGICDLFAEVAAEVAAKQAIEIEKNAAALLQAEKARQLPVQREKVAKIMSLSGLLVRRVRIQQLAVM